jgi:hypothetical protein
MPDVLIEVRGNWLKGRKADFIEAVTGGIVRLVEHSPQSFSVPDWAGARFTHILYRSSIDAVLAVLDASIALRRSGTPSIAVLALRRSEGTCRKI